MQFPPTDSLRTELANLYEQRNLLEETIRTLQQYAIMLDEPLDKADRATESRLVN